MRKRIPSAIYRLEMKIEEEKRVLKELTALEAIDKELKEVNKEIQVNYNFGKSFITKKRKRNECHSNVTKMAKKYKETKENKHSSRCPDDVSTEEEM